MLFTTELGVSELVVVSEHQRYRTEKFNKKYYERQVFGGSKHECNVAINRKSIGELCYV
jgi:hypothetical protein